MVLASFTLKNDFWETISLQEEDLEAIYDHLLEVETPLSADSLAAIFVEKRLARERKSAEQKKSEGDKVYLPKDDYKVGDTIVFPTQEWERGSVTKVRDSRNYQEQAFKVVEVEFDGGEKREFASALLEHTLNEPVEIDENDPLLSPMAIIEHFGDGITAKIKAGLEEHSEFVYIAGKWFPRALLVDVNTGNLNLAEAVLDMNEGGPLQTIEILEQIEMPEGVNMKLAEFSLDFALQEDKRFDEVGSTGQVSWFLNRMEPIGVQKTPLVLKYHPMDFDNDLLDEQMLNLVRQLDDEYSTNTSPDWHTGKDTTVTLIYPHWRAGTLPLTPRLSGFFPSAYESPRVRFKLIDGSSGEEIPGWVVRLEKYVYGLREWYQEKGAMPGSKVILRRGANPGELIVDTEPHRSTKEWVRTALVGADGGVVYAMLKQPVSTTYDDWMMVTMPADTEPLDLAWEHRAKSPLPFEQVVVDTLRELAKLNPQSHVHAAELYSAVNVVYRCPPEQLLALLASRPWFSHVGDLHFRYDDSAQTK